MELCLAVVWKAGFVKTKIGHLAEEISKQSVESEFSFLLAGFSKM